jgi:hypothetical protein
LQATVAVAFDVHRLDCGEPLDGQPLPRADALQERRAAGADCVDARIPRIGRRLGGTDRRTVQQRHAQARPRDRGCERKGRQSRAGDDDVELLGSHASSVSTTICWFV